LIIQPFKMTRFIARIDPNGTFIYRDPIGLKQKIKSLLGKDVEISIKSLSKKRSVNQNDYYWGVVIPYLLEEIKYLDKDSLHHYIKTEFLADYSTPIPTVKSTTELSTVEMEEFLDRVRKWASSEYGLYIPLPNEEGRII